MAYTTTPYCSFSQVVNALDLSTSSQSRDQAWIESELIPESQDMIDSYLGFSFQTDGTTDSPATRNYSGKGGMLLYMLERCISFSQVIESASDVIGDLYAFVVSGSVQRDITVDCVLGPDNQVPGLYLRRKSNLAFEEGVQNYTVKGVFGRPSIPGDISRACVRTVVYWYKMRDTNYSDFIIEGMVRQHYQRSLPDDITQILERYKPRMMRA